MGDTTNLEDETIIMSSDSGIDEHSENSVENSVISPEILEEERRLESLNEKEVEKLRRQYEKEQHAEEMKKLRYKRLMSLLEKSQFYTSFMHDKLMKHLNESKKSEKGKSTSKRKRDMLEDITEDCSNELLNACKRFKSNHGEEHIIKVEEVKNINQNETSAGNKIRISGLGIEVPADQPMLLEGAALRDYQLEGLNWLKLLFETGMNGILADEMGLGKTVQIIGLICHLYENNVHGPFLIVAPLSTLPNWLIEFSNFAPQIPVVLYHGPESGRISLRRSIKKKTLIGDKKLYPVVLTSFEIPVKDAYYLKDYNWRYIIVDEGHRLKNYKSQLARSLSCFKSVNRLLLTGTPLQNNLIELWSLLHFLLPEIFDTYDVFQSWFEVEDIERADIAERLIEQEKKDHVLALLHKILSPFLLRRVKSEVNLHLPPKKEVIVYCPLTLVQRKLYEALLDRSILTLMKEPETGLIIPDNPDGTKAKRWSALRKNNDVCNRPSKNSSEQEENSSQMLVVDSGIDQYSLNLKMQNIPMMLRKVVNHPFLIQMPVLPGSEIMRIDESLVTASGKMVMLEGLLTRLKKRGHKVLIFSTMTQILNLIEEYLLMSNYHYERLDGNTKLEERKEAIYRFNQNEDCFLFLISTRAGGLGINLTSADTVIIFDSDWNPQADLQAQDRCHRIGQTKPVMVYRLVTKGSIDEKIVSRAAAKRKLERLIIQGGNFSHLKASEGKDFMNYEDLKALLNNKQHNMEIHSDGSVLTEEQWECLLYREHVQQSEER